MTIFATDDIDARAANAPAAQKKPLRN